MLRHYEQLLRNFPYSKLSKTGSIVRIHAISWDEPPVFEKAFEDADEVDGALEAAKEFVKADGAVLYETSWDLWQFTTEWALAPARVILACFGPRFESEIEDNLRIDLGIDSRFLPQPEIEQSAFMAQSNIRSLLHLTAQLDSTLNPETRSLWTDSGDNFAERLQRILEGDRGTVHEFPSRELPSKE
jgi:hypothetical protein